MPVALASVYAEDENVRNMYERFLYDLLKQRKPWENISHQQMPTYEDHVKFVRSKPYKDWFIIDYRGPVGAIYITDKDEIGIFIDRHMQGHKIGSAALTLLMAHYPDVEHFYANIGAFNSRSLAFFSMKGFKVIDHVFKDNKLLQYVCRYDRPKITSSSAE